MLFHPGYLTPRRSFPPKRRPKLGCRAPLPPGRQIPILGRMEQTISYPGGAKCSHQMAPDRAGEITPPLIFVGVVFFIAAVSSDSRFAASYETGVQPHCPACRRARFCTTSSSSLSSAGVTAARISRATGNFRRQSTFYPRCTRRSNSHASWWHAIPGNGLYFRRSCSRDSGNRK
jgi:hypothetical protein